MKQRGIHALTMMLIAIVAGLAAAQPLDDTLTTEGGLSVGFPAGWSVVESGMMKVDVTTPDGWLITIAVGADANYEFSGDGYASPADIMQHFVDFMRLTGATITDNDPVVIEIGIIAGLHQTMVTHTGVPFEAVAYTLPDGMSALALVGNQGTSQPIPSDIRDTFFAVLSSATVDAPVGAVEPDVPVDDVYVPEGATLISDLPAGVLSFADGVETTYPNGWTIYSESDYIEHTASLLYGTDLFDYDALALITVQDSMDMAIEMFYETILPMSALLYTGRETFDPARDIITETLPDGRILAYLDTSDAGAVTGNIYIVTLDARFWVWTMLTVITPEGAADRAAEMLALMQTMTLVLPNGAVEYDGFQLLVQAATCDRVLTTDDVNQSVPYALFTCPAGCAGEGYSVWGTDIYTLDSSICAAAIHAGAISNADGGSVLTTWQTGQESYVSTERNGILTIEYGAWGDSFSVASFMNADNE